MCGEPKESEGKWKPIMVMTDHRREAGVAGVRRMDESYWRMWDTQTRKAGSKPL